MSGFGQGAKDRYWRIRDIIDWRPLTLGRGLDCQP